jgi:hypothetical protein
MQGASLGPLYEAVFLFAVRPAELRGTGVCLSDAQTVPIRAVAV